MTSTRSRSGAPAQETRMCLVTVGHLIETETSKSFRFHALLVLSFSTSPVLIISIRVVSNEHLDNGICNDILDTFIT